LAKHEPGAAELKLARRLHPEVELTGLQGCAMPPVDLESEMWDIDDACEKEVARLLRLREPG